MRSMMPKKLKMYAFGFRTVTIRRIYSTVNAMVKIHSSVLRIRPYFALMDSTLSSITAATLRAMTQRRITSNLFPAGVSASKIISWRRRRQSGQLSSLWRSSSESGSSAIEVFFSKRRAARQCGEIMMVGEGFYCGMLRGWVSTGSELCFIFRTKRIIFILHDRAEVLSG